MIGSDYVNTSTNLLSPEQFDTTTDSRYNKDEVRCIAEASASQAIMNFMHLLSSDAAIFDNCTKQYSACPDMNGGQAMANRIKAQIKINGQKRWVCGSNVQDLVEKAIEASSSKPDISPLTLQEYAEDYMQRYKANGSIEHNTLTGYIGYLKNHIYPFFGAMPIASITVNDLQDYVNLKAATLSQKSIREHINLLRQIFAAAIEDELVDRNPCLSSRLQIIGSKSIKVMAYTEEEFAELEHLLPFLDGTNKLFLALSLYTGMRQGELFALQWEDIDLTQNLIHVTKAVEWACQNKGTIKSPKTENGVRTIIIIKQLADVLKPLNKPSGYVLTAERQEPDEPMSHQAVKRLNERIENAAKEHGCKTRFLSHRARHTVATFLNNAGADDVSITGIIGHSDVAFTKRQYANTQTVQLQRGMDKFSNYIQKIAAS